jgi:2-keto-4-pentenoate hydratase/2-oxohepta-3-ene-1,7-dioic acid hydratase in catechol pathway
MPSLVVPGRAEPVAVGKIIGIGQNYARHAAEMRSAPPEEPMLFLKPSTAVVRDGGEVVLPGISGEVHHEVELVVIVGRGGRSIPESEALSHVAGYAVGLDMTARDLQARAKNKGHPWAVAKGFDSFAPLGPVVGAGSVPDPQTLDLELRVNGEVRQAGTTADMIFPVRTLIAYCSKIFTLEPGDLVYTGTPEGVGAVRAGDVLHARIADWPTLTVTVRGA